jgi:hypothetical protein
LARGGRVAPSVKVAAASTCATTVANLASSSGCVGHGLDGGIVTRRHLGLSYPAAAQC